MNIQNNTNLSFKGYDVLPLKSLYMQGIRKRGEINIFNEMKAIARKEGLDLYLNQDGMAFSEDYAHKTVPFLRIPIWGQDAKAFVSDGLGKKILWNYREPLLASDDTTGFNDYKVCRRKCLPRGGNYYLGYKPNGEKWMIINSVSMTTEEASKKNRNKPTKELICKLFDIKPENLIILTSLKDDLDEIIRPMGFPYILVNDYRESWKILNKMRKKFPQSTLLYENIHNYLSKNINAEMMPISLSADEVCKKLEEQGFKPIRIGARYIEDINYINALAFENKEGKISYITNSAKDSYPELEYIEKLFDEDLRAKAENVSETYYVSGGKRTEEEKIFETYSSQYVNGLKNRNVIMDILANRFGGIHCMTAEVPDFDKIQKRILNTII